MYLFDVQDDLATSCRGYDGMYSNDTGILDKDEFVTVGVFTKYLGLSIFIFTFSRIVYPILMNIS